MDVQLRMLFEVEEKYVYKEGQKNHVLYIQQKKNVFPKFLFFFKCSVNYFFKRLKCYERLTVSWENIIDKLRSLFMIINQILC